MIFFCSPFQFLKQQVEYLREDGKAKDLGNGDNGMLTIVETDPDMKASPNTRRKHDMENGNKKIRRNSRHSFLGWLNLVV